MTETNNFIYGKNAVIEALESSDREFNRILILILQEVMKKSKK